MITLQHPRCVRRFLAGEHCVPGCSCMEILPDIDRQDPSENYAKSFPDGAPPLRVFFVLRMMRVQTLRIDFNRGHDNGSIDYATWCIDGHELRPSIAAYTTWSPTGPYLHVHAPCYKTGLDAWLELCGERLVFASAEEAEDDAIHILFLLFMALEQPIWANYGYSFAGSFSIEGALLWNVDEGICSLTGSEENSEQLIEPYESQLNDLYRRWAQLPEGSEKESAREEYEAFLDGITEDMYETTELDVVWTMEDELHAMMQAFDEKHRKTQKRRLLALLGERQRMLCDLHEQFLSLESALFTDK